MCAPANPSRTVATRERRGGKPVVVGIAIKTPAKAHKIGETRGRTATLKNTKYLLFQYAISKLMSSRR